MKQDEKEARGRQVEAMMLGEGWQWTEEALKKEIESVENSLLTGSFSDISEVKELQGRLSGLKFLFDKLDRWIEEKNRIISSE